MNRKNALAIALIILAAASLARGQQAQETIEFNGVTLSLGMLQTSVLQQLGALYDLKEIEGAKGGWVIFDKQRPSISRGGVTFKDGKLVFISKNWTTTDEPDTKNALANALYGAVSSLEQEGKHSCTLETRRGQTPKLESKSVVIMCGQKQLQVGVVKGPHIEGAAVIQEELNSLAN